MGNSHYFVVYNKSPVSLDERLDPTLPGASFYLNETLIDDVSLFCAMFCVIHVVIYLRI